MTQSDTATRLILVAAQTHNPALRARLTTAAVRQVQAGVASNALDAGQVGLDAVGLIPGWGEIADGINALVCLVRGDFWGAAFSIISMVPEVGDAIGKSGKVALWVSRLAKKEGKLGKLARAVITKAPIIKQSIKQFAELVTKHKGVILQSLKTVIQLVAAMQATEGQTGKNTSPAMASAAKMISKSPQASAAAKKAAPYMSKLQESVLATIALSGSVDGMFQKLEARAQAEVSGVAA